MGRILELKNTDSKKIIASIELTSEEYSYLKGNIENIRIFSDNNLEKASKLVQRGQKEATKYFLLPRSLRNGIIPCTNVKCNRMTVKDKDIFIFKIKKQITQ